MITPYNAQQTVTDYGLGFSNLQFSATLAATTNTQLTVPGSAPRYKALIKCEPSGEVWVAKNATAAAPGGSSFAASTSELLVSSFPLCREVKAGDVLNFYSSTATTDVSVSFFALNTPN